MSKLEDAVKQLDQQYAANPAFKKESTNDKALRLAADMIFSLSQEQRNEAERHVIASKKLQRHSMSIHAANLILRGQPGFLRCSQGWNDLQPGFTCFEEIVPNLLEPMVDVSLERMRVSFGKELWAIDDRGMMTLVDAIRDTTD